MPNIGSVVNLLNTSLKAGNFSARPFQNGNYNGIAEPIKTENKEGQDVITPNIISNNGDATELVYDDKYPFRLFHLKDGWDYKQAEPNYGAAGTTMEESAGMKLVFVGSRASMNITLDNVLASVAMDIPKEFTASQLSSLNCLTCVLELGEIVTDPYTIFSQIWTNNEYSFDTDTIAFIMRYKITTTYNRGCFNLCSTENSPYYV